MDDDRTYRLASGEEVRDITTDARIKCYAIASAIRAEVVVEANQSARTQVFC
jgi:hypothetical protein